MKKPVILCAAIFVMVAAIIFSCKKLDAPVPGNFCFQVTRTSAAGTDSQMVAVNAAITPITYTASGSISTDTSAVDTIHINVVGALPPGVRDTLVGGVLTIFGTPTSAVGSPFTYTLTTTGSSCNTTTIKGTIIVTNCATINLTSAPATAAQALTINTDLHPITYAIGGGGTGATVTGLPAGVNGNYASGVFTITGSPTTRVGSPFTYTVTTTGDSCSSIATGKITVDSVAIATISTATDTICSATSATILFTGTPNATASYTINAGAPQTIVLAANGTATVSTGSITANVTYTLVSILLPSSVTQSITGSVNVIVRQLPTAVISGSTTISSGTGTTLTFNGTANAIVVYKINGGPNQSITLDGTGTATLATGNLTSLTTYGLVSVTSATAPFCVQAATGSATVSMAGTPPISNSGGAICNGTATTVTFINTPNSTIFYTVNNGPVQTIVLDGTGEAVISTGSLTANTTYSLVGIESYPPPSTEQPLSGSTVVTVQQLPVATISVSGGNPIISGSSSIIKFSGTANAIVIYTINSGANQLLLLDAFGQASLSTGNLAATTTYTLVTVATPGTPSCQQVVMESAVVTVSP